MSVEAASLLLSDVNFGVNLPIPGDPRDIEPKMDRFCEEQFLSFQECLCRIEKPLGVFVDIVLIIVFVQRPFVFS